ncbi:MAG: DUF4239 domain-containing protein [Acidimicrobiales bacterium]
MENRALTDLPLPAVVAGLISGSVGLAVGGLLLVRRVRQGHPRHNDFIGLIFAQIALLYSVLLAFMVFSVWQRFTDSGRSVTDEAAAVVVAYRDTQNLPEPLRSEAQAAFRAYVQEVMDNEWESHGTVRPHQSRDALNPLWNSYRKYQPTEALDQSELDGALGRLHDLERQRHLRHLAGEASLPGVFWWLLLGGGIVTVSMTFLFGVERRSVHVLQVGLLSAAIGSVLSLIFALNFPFTGDVHVSRGPFQHALFNFDAIDLQSGAPPAPLPVRLETVTVDARQPFADTGIDVAVGDRVAIGATGTIFHDANGSTGPNGVAERRDLRQFNVMETENHGALIGRTGQSGPPFAVGSDFSSSSLAPGRLFLGINDVGLDNNRGSFTVTVTVRRA